MTNIEWAEKSWNPFTGCDPVSPGCMNCYAKRDANRLAHNPSLPEAVRARYEGFKVNAHRERMKQPRHWKKPRRVFVCSMGDLFHKKISFNSINSIFNMIIECQRHEFLLLTKRPERMVEYFMTGNLQQICEARKVPFPLPNVWLGTSIENQKMADLRIPALQACPAVIRFLSIEPMLENIFLYFQKNTFIQGEGWSIAPKPSFHWVICGGETGPGARPVPFAGPAMIRNQCEDAGVPFFFKSWGGVRKSEAHNILEGKTYMEYPNDK